MINTMIKIPILKMKIIKTTTAVQIIIIRTEMTNVVVEGAPINTIPHKLNKQLKLTNMTQYKLNKLLKLINMTQFKLRKHLR